MGGQHEAQAPSNLVKNYRETWCLCTKWCGITYNLDKSVNGPAPPHCHRPSWSSASVSKVSMRKRLTNKWLRIDSAPPPGFCRGPYCKRTNYWYFHYLVIEPILSKRYFFCLFGFGWVGAGHHRLAYLFCAVLIWVPSSIHQSTYPIGHKLDSFACVTLLDIFQGTVTPVGLVAWKDWSHNSRGGTDGRHDVVDESMVIKIWMPTLCMWIDSPWGTGRISYHSAFLCGTWQRLARHHHWVDRICNEGHRWQMDYPQIPPGAWSWYHWCRWDGISSTDSCCIQRIFSRWASCCCGQPTQVSAFKEDWRH